MKPKNMHEVKNEGHVCRKITKRHTRIAKGNLDVDWLIKNCKYK